MSQNVGLVSQIVMADGSSYSFTYTASGALYQMTLPTGGVVTYSGNEGIESSCGSTEVSVNTP